MKKLYTAKVEIDIVVVAEDKDEAKLIALSSLDTDSPFIVDVEDMVKLPEGWDLGLAPFGKRGYEPLTIEEWVDIGAAPVYQESVD